MQRISVCLEMPVMFRFALIAYNSNALVLIRFSLLHVRIVRLLPGLCLLDYCSI